MGKKKREENPKTKNSHNTTRKNDDISFPFFPPPLPAHSRWRDKRFNEGWEGKEGKGRDGGYVRATQIFVFSTIILPIYYYYYYHYVKSIERIFFRWGEGRGRGIWFYFLYLNVKWGEGRGVWIRHNPPLCPQKKKSFASSKPN